MAAKGGQAAGLAYLFDCEPGERIRARLAARFGQQFGVLDEAERIPRGSNRTLGELAHRRLLHGGKIPVQDELPGAFPDGRKRQIA